MLVKILLLRQDQFTIEIKKSYRGIYGKATKEDFKDLKDEGNRTLK